MRHVITAALVLALAGCGTGGSSTVELDRRGGAVAIRGGSLVVPEGALGRPLEDRLAVTLETRGAAPPDFTLVRGPVVSIGPEGLVFDRPAGLRLHAPAATETEMPAIYFRPAGDEEWTLLDDFDCGDDVCGAVHGAGDAVVAMVPRAPRTGDDDALLLLLVLLILL